MSEAFPGPERARAREAAATPDVDASTGARVRVRDADGSGAMFNRIARRYDHLNRIISLGMDRSWRRQLVDALGPLTAGDEVLDVATGTADIAISVARRYPGVRVTGVDPSVNMLDVGREKLEALGDRVSLVEGDAQAMSFDDDRFAGACIAFGIRNVPDRARGLREMARVTRPGGRVVVLELGEPDRGPLAPFARFHAYQVVPRIGAWLSGDDEYAYLAKSIEAFPKPDAFTAMMEAAGLDVDEVRPFVFGAANLFIGTVAAAAG
ncbi:MAG: bifunctional demethylmenaquinone methyltransferase/2-methoxy-6-polyprenyl-1,4-benzoquinol methylase UbiE [Myxococcota bacterium]